MTTETSTTETNTAVETNPCKRELTIEVPADVVKDEREKIIGGDDSPPKLELWWLFLVIVTLLLCAEVWMTRRIALNR